VPDWAPLNRLTSYFLEEFYETAILYHPINSSTGRYDQLYKNGIKKADDKTPVAFVNGDPVTEGDLNTLVGSYLKQIERRIHQVKEGAVNHLVEQKLWEQAAKKAGMDKDAWMKSQVDPSEMKVTDKELNEIWAKQKDRVKMKKEEFIPQLRAHLERQKQNQSSQKILAKLRADAEKSGNIKILISEPAEELIKIDTTGAAILGKKNAKVSIVEFSDFQCTFCARSQETLHKVLEHYGDKVNLVVMDFPLKQHPEAKPAAVASYCVKDQNESKFWEFRKLAFERTENRQDLKGDALKEMAKKLEVDMAKFDACMKENKHAKLVDQLFASGQKIGVSGTPSFFIGTSTSKMQKISAAPTFENFKKQIDCIVVDMKGKVVRGSTLPSSEIKMHLKVYELRADVRGVIHAHPPKCLGSCWAKFVDPSFDRDRINSRRYSNRHICNSNN